MASLTRRELVGEARVLIIFLRADIHFLSQGFDPVNLEQSGVNNRGPEVQRPTSKGLKQAIAKSEHFALVSTSPSTMLGVVG